MTSQPADTDALFFLSTNAQIAHWCKAGSRDLTNAGNDFDGTSERTCFANGGLHGFVGQRVRAAFARVACVVVGERTSALLRTILNLLRKLEVALCFRDLCPLWISSISSILDTQRSLTYEKKHWVNLETNNC